MKYKDFHDNVVEKPSAVEATFRPSVYAMIEQDGKILLIQDGRSGNWEFPGGSMNIGESIQETLLREVIEETGYTIVSEETPVCITDRLFYHNPKDKFYHTIGIFFKAKLAHSDKIELNLDSPDEIAQAKWVTMEELKETPMISYYGEAKQKICK